MTWTKLSDDFSDDCWRLSDEAFRLHVEGLLWSNRKLLDLRIPKADLRMFAKHPDAVPELLAVGWWADEGEDYFIRHHGVYQRASEAVVRQQSANRANGRLGGLSTRPTREIANPTGSESLSESLSERDRTGRARLVVTASAEELAPETQRHDEHLHRPQRRSRRVATPAERLPAQPQEDERDCNGPLDPGCADAAHDARPVTS